MSPQEAREGVVKFTFEHQSAALVGEDLQRLLAELMAWRAILRDLSLIGRDPELYDGAGYGNVSARVRPFPGERGQRRFLVSGTQTGGLACITPEEYCLVQEYDMRRNFVRSLGQIRPSSETMTHGAIFDLDPSIRYVFHGHSQSIWPVARALGIPTTDPAVPYGTPAMAEEVRRLYRTSILSEVRIFAMGGHEDGIVVFGKTALEAGTVLIRYLALAHMRTAAVSARLCD